MKSTNFKNKKYQNIIRNSFFLVIFMLVIQTSNVYAKTVTDYQTSYYDKNNFSIQSTGDSININQIPEMFQNKYLWFQIYSLSSKSVVKEEITQGTSLQKRLSLASLSEGKYYLYLANQIP